VHSKTYQKGEPKSYTTTEILSHSYDGKVTHKSRAGKPKLMTKDNNNRITGQLDNKENNKSVITKQPMTIVK
jgi:hypothetical protein